MEASDNPQLYSVLPEKRVDRFGNQMMGSTFTYDVASGGPPSKQPRRDGVEMALDPSELEMDPSEINSRLEKKLQDSRAHLVKESHELSDMVSRHIQDTKKKTKTSQDDSNKSKKKHKDFKF